MLVRIAVGKGCCLMTTYQLASEAWERIKIDLTHRGLYDGAAISRPEQREIDAHQIDAILKALDYSRGWPAFADQYVAAE